MSRNKVQFQKGMSIHSFIEKYGNFSLSRGDGLLLPLVDQFS